MELRNGYISKLEKKLARGTIRLDTNYEIPPQSRKFEPGYSG